MRACSPVITFSSADMNANSRMFWNVRAIPALAMRLVVRPVRSRGRRTRCGPAVGA